MIMEIAPARTSTSLPCCQAKLTVDPVFGACFRIEAPVKAART